MGKGKRNKHWRHEKGKLVEITTPSPSKVYKQSVTKPQVATDFKLTIPKDVHQKIMYWINKSNFEVSGFGSLDYDEKENEFRVRDVILLTQEVGPGSAEICPIALNRAMFQQKDEPNALKWHWHSHVNMEVFWSSDDHEVIRSLGQPGWIVASVFNKKEEIRSAFLTTVEVFGRKHDIFQDNLSTFIEVDAMDSAVKAQLDEEYDRMVKPEPPSYNNSYYGGLGGGFGLGHTPSQVAGPGGSIKNLPSPVHANDERRWAPTVAQLSRCPNATEYDDTGWAAIDNDLIYNPCFDDEVQTNAQLMLAIDNMEWSNIQALRNVCKEFASALEMYWVWKADPKTEVEELSELDVIDMTDPDKQEQLELARAADDYQPTWLGEDY